MTDDRITVTVKEFCRLSGLGRRKVFEMCKEGAIERVKLSPRHSLIVLASWQRFVDEKKGQHSRAEMAGDLGESRGASTIIERFQSHAR